MVEVATILNSNKASKSTVDRLSEMLSNITNAITFTYSNPSASIRTITFQWANETILKSSLLNGGICIFSLLKGTPRATIVFSYVYSGTGSNYYIKEVGSVTYQCSSVSVGSSISSANSMTVAFNSSYAPDLTNVRLIRLAVSN